MNPKTKVIKDYDKLTDEFVEQIKLVYPKGFRKHLIEFKDITGVKRKGLPFETEDKIYLIRMSVEKAIYIIDQDDDYDVNGRLKSRVQNQLEEKYEDEDFLELNDTTSDEDLEEDMEDTLDEEADEGEND